MPTRRENPAGAGAPAADEPVPRDPRADHAARERRRWLDFRRAVREAKAAGAFAISAKGFKVWLQPPPTPPPSNSTTEGAATQQDARQETQPSARRRRSAKRMHEFVLRKRYQQLASCRLRLSLLRAMRIHRWQRTQAVWTQWMRESSRAPAAVPMLLESSEQPAPPPAPPKTKRGAEGRSPVRAEPASDAAQPSSPNTTGGKQPRLTYAAAAGGSGGASSIDYASWRVNELKTELERRGLEATGLSAQGSVLVARLQALALPPPPPT